MIRTRSQCCSEVLLPLLLSLVMATIADASELMVGSAFTSITPEQPIALWGQMHTRISTAVESPCTATVLVLESIADGVSVD